MQPTVASNAQCPCGSGRKYRKCCGHAVPPPPQSHGELMAWASARGVQDQLRTVFDDALWELEERVDCPSWARRQALLEIMASGQLLPSRPSGLAHLREVAWTFLQREAESVQAAIAAEARPRPPPAHPDLAHLAARFVELRERLRARLRGPS